MSNSNREDLALVICVVYEGSLWLKSASAGGRKVEHIIGREWKVRAGRNLEGATLRVLKEGSSHAILSEESSAFVGKGKHQWLVDPLDGSANFARELPFYAIFIGLWEDGQSLLGAALDVSSERLFSGIVGEGHGAIMSRFDVTQVIAQDSKKVFSVPGCQSD